MYYEQYATNVEKCVRHIHSIIYKQNGELKKNVNVPYVLHKACQEFEVNELLIKKITKL